MVIEYTDLLAFVYFSYRVPDRMSIGVFLLFRNYSPGLLVNPLDKLYVQRSG